MVDCNTKIIPNIYEVVSLQFPSHEMSKSRSSLTFQGCYTTVVNFINSSGKLIGIICLAVAGFQILGLALTCMLANCINKWKYETIL